MNAPVAPDALKDAMDLHGDAGCSICPEGKVGGEFDSESGSECGDLAMAMGGVHTGFQEQPEEDEDEDEDEEDKSMDVGDAKKVAMATAGAHTDIQEQHEEDEAEDVRSESMDVGDTQEVSM